MTIIIILIGAKSCRQVTHVFDPIIEVYELLEKTFGMFLTFEEQKRLQLLTAVELAAVVRSIPDGNADLLVLLLEESDARPVDMKVVLRQCAEVCKIVAIAALVENLAEENNELELLAQVQGLRQWKILVGLVMVQVLEKFAFDAVLAAIVFARTLVARAAFLLGIAEYPHRLSKRREVRSIHEPNRASARVRPRQSILTNRSP